METNLNLHDIQGIIMKNYAESGFIYARYLFLQINNGKQGRIFLEQINKHVTTAARWTDNADDPHGTPEPDATTNISFTYNGLKKLGISIQTLHSFPDEFAIGMRGRRSIIGDDYTSAPDKWDSIWNDKDKEVHMFISMDAKDPARLEARYNEVVAMVDGLEKVKDKNGNEVPSVVLLDGNKSAEGGTKPYQEAQVIFDGEMPTAKEHFGYTDGISNPFFKGMLPEMGSVIGGGKKNGGDKERNKLGHGNPLLASTWAPLETGEFILGHEDEAQEYPVAPTPSLMGKNGSFMVYRKLHENVGAFNKMLNEQGKDFPGGKEALASKFAGRWRNGAPVVDFPTEEAANEIAGKRQKAIYDLATAETPQDKEKAALAFAEVNKRFTGFDFQNDLHGGKCPVGAHIRRVNPRGSLEEASDSYKTPSALANRRRIIRRGLPYGTSTPDSNTGEHGIIFMAIQASIKRQFEFVTQQWVNYGSDFKLANEKDAMIGNQCPVHHENENLNIDGCMAIPADKGKVPYFVSQIPRLVETRGGDYFFIPSITTLEMMAKGIVDPT